MWAWQCHKCQELRAKAHSVQFTKNVKHFCAQKSPDFLGLIMIKNCWMYLRVKTRQFYPKQFLTYKITLSIH